MRLTSVAIARKLLKEMLVGCQAWAVVKRSLARNQKEQASSNEVDGVRLAPIGTALAGALALAIVGVAGLVAALLMVWGSPVLAPTPTLSLPSLLEVIKISVAAVAGIGGVIALVVAYRRQRVVEATSALEHSKEDRERSRLFNERFATACGQLGEDHAAVRLAGVHALAGLADDWPAGRQTCIDVLCAYLRMPYELSPEPDASVEHRLQLRSIAEVRRTIWRIIGAHLRSDQESSWHGHDFDFTGAVIDCDVPFFEVRLSAGTLMFSSAKIVSGNVWFHNAEFSGCQVFLTDMELLGGDLSFQGASFSNSVIWLVGTRFRGGEVSFGHADFSGAEVWFHKAEFGGSKTWFDLARFLKGKVYFGEAIFNGSQVTFEGARFEGGEVDLRAASGVDPASFKLPSAAPGLLLPPSEQPTAQRDPNQQGP
ncbi:pentapeptide repeat-containing protein [Nonomuraea fuscirosea]|uniref:pentapeptide repeat-containing protein n=1 Tax=Nonomuraea fuscirosea TaxID=1291556 RepID=UPI0034404F9B